MPDQLVQFKASLPARLIMLLTVLLALISSWYVVRWYLGNTMAEYFNPDEARLETAQMAVGLAPSDPLPYWRLGDLIKRTRPPDQINLAIAQLERAVSLSPNDYRYWMELGTSLEQAGEHERAEKALRQAVSLAPSYAYPRWYLGNLLVRGDRYDEAFAELRFASDADDEFQPQLFNLAAHLYKDDFDAMTKAIGSRPATRAAFAKYLLARGRFAEGLNVWNGLSEEEKKSSSDVAALIIEDLKKNNRYHAAVAIWNSIAPSPSYHAQVDQIMDPSFEGNVAHGSGVPFGWHVPTLPSVQIGITPATGHDSPRSLRVFFQVSSNLTTDLLLQVVPVRPSTSYEFECFVKTEKMVSGVTPVVSITDAPLNTVVATSAPAPNGDTDWQKITLSFTTSPDTEAIILKVTRPSCGDDSPVCPLFGTVWYDDFNLKTGK